MRQSSSREQQILRILRRSFAGGIVASGREFTGKTHHISSACRPHTLDLGAQSRGAIVPRSFVGSPRTQTFFAGRPLPQGSDPASSRGHSTRRLSRSHAGFHGPSRPQD